MKKHLSCIVSGRVQGVFFRAYTRSQAEKLSLAGYVENLDDGTVRVEAEGDEEGLEKFKKELWKGSRWSRVENVDCQTFEDLKDYGEFTIKRGSFFDRF